jgi:seryl-tRNA synthetase
MSTFSEKAQNAHRNSFIDECRYKAWAAACNADFVSKSIDKLLGDHGRLKQEDDQLAADIKELEKALDSHTVDNRNKRKTLQERRNAIGKQMEFLVKTAQQGMGAMQQMLANVETNLDLAKHAETWEWKEAEPKPPERHEAAA